MTGGETSHWRVVLNGPEGQFLSDLIDDRWAVDLGLLILSANDECPFRPIGVWRVSPKFRGEFVR